MWKLNTILSIFFQTHYTMIEFSDLAAILNEKWLQSTWHCGGTIFGTTHLILQPATMYVRLTGCRHPAQNTPLSPSSIFVVVVIIIIIFHRYVNYALSIWWKCNWSFLSRAFSEIFYSNIHSEYICLYRNWWKAPGFIYHQRISNPMLLSLS